MRGFLCACVVTLLAIFGVMSMPLATVQATPAYFAASSSDEVCEAIGAVDPNNTSNACNPKAEGAINKLLRLTINLLSIVAGVISVIMLMIAGLKYMTSQGDASQTASAKNTLIYALVGLVIVAFAQLIVAFVLTNTT